MQMKDDGTPTTRPLSFTHYLIIAILLVLIPVVVLISYIDYAGVEQQQAANDRMLQNQTERSILLSIALVDTGLRHFDDSLTQEMREGFTPVLAEYERAGGDPARMDLEAVKTKLGGVVDLYIINESGVIEYTTFKPDLGFDFTTIPYFYEYITDLRQNGDFAADRIVNEISTGALRKYAYMPTPDRRYLLELGLAESEFQKYRSMLKYKDTVARVIELNPNIDSLRIFNSRGKQVTKETVPDEDARHAMVMQAYEQKRDLELVNGTTGDAVRFIFVDLTSPDYGADTSLIVELAYNTKLAAEQLDRLLFTHALIALIALLLTVELTLIAAHRITRPIRDMADDVDAIAHGDLDHPIRASGGVEFVRLERSITTMVTALKAHIERLRASEQKEREHSEHLEEQVRERTADLQRSSEKVNLYLDIMTHDISNANNVASLYADLLLSEVAGEPEEVYVKNVRKGLEKSAQILRNVSTIRRIRETRLPLRSIDLDGIIRSEIGHYPCAAISYTGTDAYVLADELLPVIFTNLLGNAVKFGGTGITIAIRVEEQEKTIRVSVEDTGPGIPEDLKETIFNRFRRGNSRASGSGLGLYICRMLIERYGGRIWTGERVPGRPGEGAAFRFTLNRGEPQPDDGAEVSRE
ncbi:histidine kinase [Methanoculleus taiwanensis]|uniref:histidine kinase n=1 Tax=Methanoculleus taiwanensis TaxID=1550565 RepID=A0A498H1M0_9EURY|nr:HAMP domain-containing sensor histidine kinase [Methanoculleus taiwanensis]RXE56498.1 histidine kinase [Methanoculleus taiwanensis]